MKLTGDGTDAGDVAAASDVADAGDAASPGSQRTAELHARLTAVRARIAAACSAAGRPVAEITLVAVSKTWPAADVLRLMSLGQRHFGENREREAAVKAAEVAAGVATGWPDGDSGTAAAPPVWHFVGQLQTNKARSVVRYASVVHSVDRLALVRSLSAATMRHPKRSEPLTALVQVSLDDPAVLGRGGAAPTEVPMLADAVAGAAGLSLGGVMAVAPRDGDPDVAFSRLAEVASVVRRAHPAATIISAGMSDDLEAAVRHGATLLRVGTAIFGGRATVVG